MARKQIKSLKKILPDFRELVRSLKPLQVGRKFPNFSILPREAWGNWLVCAVLNKEQHTNKIVFAEDNKVDGLIVDTRTGEFCKTEHVSALDVPSGIPQKQGEQRIIDAIEKKIAMGDEYAKNKVLIVFFDGVGEWYRNKVRWAINGRHKFKKIYLVGLLDENQDEYTYTVTRLHKDDSESYSIKINASFTEWDVKKIL